MQNEWRYRLLFHAFTYKPYRHLEQGDIKILMAHDSTISSSKESFSSENNVKFSSVYCLKTLGAFFVVCIHCFSPWIIYPIIRTAVPFFFIISGFFLYRENSQQALTKCINTFKKIFWITLYANIFYYIAFFVPANIFPIKTLESFIAYITIGERLGFHLWYLNAYLETLIIIIVALKFKALKQVWYFIPLFIVAGLITGKYEFLFPYLPNNIVLSRNCFTIGIPCFGIGWLIRQYNKKLLKVFSAPFLLTVLILVLSICENTFLRYINNRLVGDYIITTFPLAASLVLTAIKYPLFGKDSIIEKIGKEYSTHIYIFHLLVFKLFLKVNTTLLGLPLVTFPFIVFVLTILFIVLWKKCSKAVF